MNTLFLNLASRSSEPTEGACIACVTDNKTISIEFVDERISDSEIIPMIESVMQNAEWTFKDLTHIACITGPGGFTSLRVGITLANTLADQLRISIAGVPLWELYGLRASGYELRTTSESRKPEANSPIWLHSTKRTHIFKKSATDTEPVLIAVDEFIAQLTPNTEVMGELISEHQELLEKKIRKASLLSVANTLPSLIKHAAYQGKQISPWYGREL